MRGEQEQAQAGAGTSSQPPRRPPPSSNRAWRRESEGRSGSWLLLLPPHGQRRPGAATARVGTTEGVAADGVPVFITSRSLPPKAWPARDPRRRASALKSSSGASPPSLLEADPARQGPVGGALTGPCTADPAVARQDQGRASPAAAGHLLHGVLPAPAAVRLLPGEEAEDASHGAPSRPSRAKSLGRSGRVVGPPPGGWPPSAPNLEEMRGRHCFAVLLEEAAAAPSPLSAPSREFLPSPVRMVLASSG
jgi:hypothetical protein